MGNEWDTGLYKEIEILATEAVDKWGEKFYQYGNNLPEMLVRVKEQKVKLLWDVSTSRINVEVEFNNIIYEGLRFNNKNTDLKWVLDTDWSIIKPKKNCIVQGGAPVAKY